MVRAPVSSRRALHANPSRPKVLIGTGLSRVATRTPNVPLLRSSWSLLDGLWGVFKVSFGGAGILGFVMQAWGRYFPLGVSDP